jgi:hypothetical protein
MNLKCFFEAARDLDTSGRGAYYLRRNSFPPQADKFGVINYG